MTTRMTLWAGFDPRNTSSTPYCWCLTSPNLLDVLDLQKDWKCQMLGKLPMPMCSNWVFESCCGLLARPWGVYSDDFKGSFSYSPREGCSIQLQIRFLLAFRHEKVATRTKATDRVIALSSLVLPDVRSATTNADHTGFGMTTALTAHHALC